MKVRIMLISTITNKSLERAIQSVSAYCDVRLIHSYDIPKLTEETLQEIADWADIVLVDVRGEAYALNKVDFSEKDVITLVGGTSLISKSKLGKFKMPSNVGSSFVSSPESIKRRIETFQKVIETAGKILPFGVLKDARNYIKVLKYWANAGYENYKNMFLHICKIKDIEVETQEPIEFPEHGFYHPRFGFDYIPKEKSPRVGILFYGGMHFEQCQATLEMVVEKLENHNLNVIPVFSDGILNLRAMELLKNADAIISFLWFRLNGGPIGGDPKMTIETLKHNNAKLFTPILMFSQKLEDWEKEQRGVNIVNMLASVVLPEMDGAVEPITVCGVSEDEVVPIADRIEKFATRVHNWVKLKYKPNSEKRIAIVVYNYPPGEENLCNAAYLDTFQSLKIILDRLHEEGYLIEETDVEKIFFDNKLW